ncbi:uncharacterized protein DS421_8g245810 [Arachis hypogaea]|nr:uncharacterized protein DS421_8g245810 [Arachis hypogaea]
MMMRHGYKDLDLGGQNWVASMEKVWSVKSKTETGWVLFGQQRGEKRRAMSYLYNGFIRDW